MSTRSSTALPLDLLGREVARGAHDVAGAGEVLALAVGGLGDAEVGDLHPPVELDEHVARLHVAVHQPARVRGGERVGHLVRRCRPRVADRQRAVQVDRLAQGGAVHELHHDVRDAVVLAGVVGGDDVRVGDRRRGHRLPPEPGAQRLVLGEHRVEGLHRDLAREQRVLAPPHRRHAAARDLGVEPVATAEDAPGCDGSNHVPRRYPSALAPASRRSRAS